MPAVSDQDLAHGGAGGVLDEGLVIVALDQVDYVEDCERVVAD